MTIETPTETLRRFANSNWIENSSLDALTGDLLVCQAESKLEWFTCYYVDNNGVLYDPMRGPIVGNDGGSEAQKNFNNELEQWFLLNESGIAVGISPKGGKFNHPDNQIQIYRIAYELVDGRIDQVRKVLLCTFHQFDYSFNNSEALRSHIFPEKDTEEGILNIVDWLKRISNKSVSDATVNLNRDSSKAYLYASMLKNGADPNLVFQQMEKDKFLGSNPIGCANQSMSRGSVSNYTETVSMSFGYEDQYGSLEFTCPHCSGTNTRPYGQLISNCQICGANVKC